MGAPGGHKVHPGQISTRKNYSLAWGPRLGRWGLLFVFTAGLNGKDTLGAGANQNVHWFFGDKGLGI